MQIVKEIKDVPRGDAGKVADEVGFEPTEPFGSLVFKTRGLNHSPNYPFK